MFVSSSVLLSKRFFTATSFSIESVFSVVLGCLLNAVFCVVVLIVSLGVVFVFALCLFLGVLVLVLTGIKDLSTMFIF